MGLYNYSLILRGFSGSLLCFCYKSLKAQNTPKINGNPRSKIPPKFFLTTSLEGVGGNGQRIRWEDKKEEGEQEGLGLRRRGGGEDERRRKEIMDRDCGKINSQRSGIIVVAAAMETSSNRTDSGTGNVRVHRVHSAQPHIKCQ